MNVEQKVYAVLSAAAGVTGLCPASRIKPPGSQQKITAPYIVHFGMLDQTTLTHGEGLVLLKKWLYQVSCFGASYSAAKALAAAVVTAMGNYRQGNINSHLTGERTMPYDGDIAIEQIVLEFEIWDSL